MDNFTLEEVCKTIEESSDNLTEISNSVVKKYTQNADELIEFINNNVVGLSNEDVRQCMLRLSCEAYALSEVKEYNDLKKECATLLVKTSQADVSLNSQGTVDAKRNLALLNTESEQLSGILYNSVAARLKIKLDEIHRVVDALKSVLISRNSEARLTTEVDM